MASAGQNKFVLVQQDGYSEYELYESDNLQEMAEYLNSKSGGD